MDTLKILPACAVGLSVLLSACSTTGGGTSSQAVMQPATESAALIGAASVGDSVELPPGNPTGATSVDVIAEYFAASNRRCRQVLPSSTNGSVRIACERKDGGWEWVRSLSSSTVSRPLPAVASVGAVESVVVVGDEDLVILEEPASGTALSDSGESISFDEVETDNGSGGYTVLAGETLWKFSRRITGSGVNWQAIAELNNIDDARTIEAGMVLLVPANLVQGQ